MDKVLSLMLSTFGKASFQTQQDRLEVLIFFLCCQEFQYVSCRYATNLRRLWWVVTHFLNILAESIKVFSCRQRNSFNQCLLKA